MFNTYLLVLYIIIIFLFGLLSLFCLSFFFGLNIETYITIEIYRSPANCTSRFHFNMLTCYMWNKYYLLNVSYMFFAKPVCDVFVHDLYCTYTIQCLVLFLAVE